MWLSKAVTKLEGYFDTWKYPKKSEYSLNHVNDKQKSLWSQYYFVHRCYWNWESHCICVCWMYLTRISNTTAFWIFYALVSFRNHKVEESVLNVFVLVPAWEKWSTHLTKCTISLWQFQLLRWSQRIFLKLLFWNKCLRFINLATLHERNKRSEYQHFWVLYRTFFFFFTYKEATFNEGLGGENFNFSSLHKWWMGNIKGLRAFKLSYRVSIFE